jgi:phosphoribosylformylglycinamidine (FGAM) synthase-like amidotransferase family enzyme
MKAAIITFPGSNCDRDLACAFEAAGASVERIWHKETKLPQGVDLVGVPGGFSFGDYLRPVRRSPWQFRPMPKGAVMFWEFATAFRF